MLSALHKQPNCLSLADPQTHCLGAAMGFSLENTSLPVASLYFNLDEIKKYRNMIQNQKAGWF